MAAGIAATPAFAAAQTGSPALVWQNVDKLSVLCLVQTPGGIDTGALHDRICGTARRIAAQGATMPVAMGEIGSPAILDQAVVTLLVYASVSGAPGEELIAFSVRPYRNAGNDPGVLFAAPPVAIRLRDIEKQDALDGAFRRMLNGTLPWNTASSGRTDTNR